jgi:omega-amidase
MTLRVAIGEYDTGWHDPQQSVERAAALIASTARAGARLIVLPEMCTTGFTMKSDVYAEPLDGPFARRLGEAAKEHDVWVLAGLATIGRISGSTARAYNSAVLYTPSGSTGAVYHKQRLFAYGTEDEHYVPGEGPLVVSIDGVHVSPFICYDLRFPELFRATAKQAELMVVIANWPVARREHWDVLVRARAIENQCYVVAVNRIGEGGGLAYDGGSAAYDPSGTRLSAVRTAAGGDAPDVAIVDIEPARVAETREAFPFLADLR